uniref:Protein kinase domain-containing protein n=1 Tax=Macrostomum lignano TaxID=282301 RepID=A0A1I8FM13_9PLAT
ITLGIKPVNRCHATALAGRHPARGSGSRARSSRAGRGGEAAWLRLRAVEEQRRRAEEREEEAKRKEEREKKKKEAEERMKSQSQRNFTISKKSGASLRRGRSKQGKSKEQLEAEKKAALEQRPLNIDGFSESQLQEKAKELFSKIYSLEETNMILSSGSRGRIYGEARRDPAARFRLLPKIVMYSQYERVKDHRGFGERQELFKGPIYGIDPPSAFDFVRRLLAPAARLGLSVGQAELAGLQAEPQLLTGQPLGLIAGPQLTSLAEEPLVPPVSAATRRRRRCRRRSRHSRHRSVAAVDPSFRRTDNPGEVSRAGSWRRQFRGRSAISASLTFRPPPLMQAAGAAADGATGDIPAVGVGVADGDRVAGGSTLPTFAAALLAQRCPPPPPPPPLRGLARNRCRKPLPPASLRCLRRRRCWVSLTTLTLPTRFDVAATASAVCERRQVGRFPFLGSEEKQTPLFCPSWLGRLARRGLRLRLPTPRARRCVCGCRCCPLRSRSAAVRRTDWATAGRRAAEWRAKTAVGLFAGPE